MRSILIFILAVLAFSRDGNFQEFKVKQLNPLVYTFRGNVIIKVEHHKNKRTPIVAGISKVHAEDWKRMLPLKDLGLSSPLAQEEK